jgi:serine/threonine-protein kinase
MSQAQRYLANRYRLDSKIASGGMGEVWRGTDIVLGRPVAVKVLRDMDPVSHRDAMARFRAEARHVGSLSHPGIAQVYDFCDAQDPPCLVMELVDGPSLAGLLTSGPLDPARTMDIVAQTALALAEAHRAGLVHRDIKPGNLLLAPRGQVKIIDFGIAQAGGPAGADGPGGHTGTVTVAGAVVGSPAYLAPERVVGEAATPASDLYSLGIVAYECLTGRPPFSGSNLELGYAHLHQPMPSLPAHVPADVIALVEYLTAKNPAARPASANEVARRARQLSDTLARHATTRMPSMPGAITPDAPLADEAERNPTILDLRTPLAAPPPRRRRTGLLVTVAAIAVAAVAIAGLLGWQLRGAVGPGSASQPGHAAGSSVSTTPSAGTVTISADSLVGQPIWVVRRDLGRLGLRADARWVVGSQPAGTVVSVSPTGPVAVGSVIAVTAIWYSQGHGNGNGHGHGNGHGNGQGD